MSSSKPKKKKKKGSDSDDDDDDDSDQLSVASDDQSGEDAAIDTSNIIKGGRRTRGSRVDYSMFGPDRSSDEE
ncbi:MAG: hypothetical protein J3Q66DRAFT_323043 [Benniella sp.]|nr:MAG: hypothetical protein J3Q66DRAFT_323043 [Benniella sp.]